MKYNIKHYSIKHFKRDTVKKSKKHSRFVFLLAVFFLTSCQTTPEQPERSEVKPSAQGKNEAQYAALPIAQEQSQEKQKSLGEAKKLKKTKITTVQPEYAQSRQPLSEDTKKRLKFQAQELMSNGSMPKIDYQLPDSPGLQIISDQPQADQKSSAIKLDYEQVQIRQILEEFADSLKMSIVIDPSITGSLTMRTAPNASLTKDDLWPLLQMILGEAGVVLERRGEVFYAKRMQQLLPSVIGNASILGKTDASRVMQITPLKHISIDAAMTVLNPIAGPQGVLVPVPSLNTLLIVAQPEQIKRFNGLLSLIDTDPFKNRGIQLYKIREAEAKNVAKELNEILKLIEGNKPAYQVMGLERINALLVVAPPGRGFKDVNRWVDILDAGADEALIEQIFIYKCKSLKATALADTLNSIFLQDEKKKNKEVKEEDNNPNEFKTVSKESLSITSLAKRKANKKAGVSNVPVQKKTKTSNNEAASANINVTIVADEDSNALLVRTTAKDYKQLLETIRVLDMVPLQVLINVVIAQVTLNDTQSFGIDWSYLGSSGTTLQTNFGQASLVKDGTPAGLIINRLTGDWRVTLNALAEEKDVNILSRPSLLITNNQEGMINVGKEVPVKTASTTNTSSTTVDGTNVTEQIAYRKTGIELTVTPQINEDGIVNMSIKQGLSSIEGQTSGTALNPTFTNQEINTVVVVKDKETIILGGLIESVESQGESGVPVLKDVPLMGNLFKSKGSEIERRELILIISTQILNAEDDYAAFNSTFKSNFHAAAAYLDRQLADKYHARKKLNKKEW